MTTVWAVYFSGTGTTERTVTHIAGELARLLAAEENEHTADGAVTALQGWIDCFEKSRLSGIVFAGGVTSVGDIRNHPALKKAYEMGRAV